MDLADAALLVAGVLIGLFLMFAYMTYALSAERDFHVRTRAENDRLREELSDIRARHPEERTPHARPL